MRCRLRRAGQNKAVQRTQVHTWRAPASAGWPVVVAVVFTESRVEITVVPDTVNGCRLKLQAAFVGRPEHANVTASAKSSHARDV